MARDEKHKQAQHEWYLRNKEKVSTQSLAWKKNKIEEYKEWKKSLKCVDCGYEGSRCEGVLSFHHLDNNDNKSFNISRDFYRHLNLERVKAEAEKCECLCENCHRKRHLIKDDTTKLTSAEKRNKKWYIEFKGMLSCEQCGENHQRCLDFHHTDDNKEENVANLARSGTSIDRIITEIEKCRVLCANCHRELMQKV